MITDCYGNIVGLSDVDCECVDTPPTGYDDSSTSYYITDNDYGIPFQAAIYTKSDCFDGDTIWEYLEKVRQKTYKKFDADFRQTIYTKYQTRNSTFKGEIGKKKSQAVRLKNDLVGIRIKPKQLKGACLYIKSIELNLNSNETVTINVHSNETEEVLHSFTVDTVAGQYTEVNEEVSFELPLYSDCTDLEYYVTYTVPNGSSPNGNKFHCCGDKRLWRPYFNLNGLEGDSLDDLTFKGNQAYGLVINGSVACNELNWICDLSEVQDKLSGKGYTLQNVIGRAIQYSAGIRGVNDMLKTNRINFYTSLNMEGLYKHRSRLSKLYNEHLAWLVENLPLDDNDCLKCKENKHYRKKSLMI